MLPSFATQNPRIGATFENNHQRLPQPSSTLMNLRALPARRRHQSPSTCTKALSTFLRLPVELRRMIYLHITPNKDPGTFDTHPNPKDLRHDGGPCCPSLLRVNRQIYQELLPEWYGYLLYTAEIKFYKQRGFSFLGKITSPGESLPSTLRSIRSLSLFVTLHPTDIVRDRFQEYIAILQQCFPPDQGQGHLKKLHIRLEEGFYLFKLHRLEPNKLRDLLECHLSPLRNLREIPDVHFEFTLHPGIRKQLGREQDYATWEMNLMEAAREFLNKLELHMTGRSRGIS